MQHKWRDNWVNDKHFFFFLWGLSTQYCTKLVIWVWDTGKIYYRKDCGMNFFGAILMYLNSITETISNGTWNVNVNEWCLTTHRNLLDHGEKSSLDVMYVSEMKWNWYENHSQEMGYHNGFCKIWVWRWERIESWRPGYIAKLSKGSFTCQCYRSAKYKRSWNPMGISPGPHGTWMTANISHRPKMMTTFSIPTSVKRYHWWTWWMAECITFLTVQINPALQHSGGWQY